MNAEQIITTLTSHGVRLTRDRTGALRAGPASAVTPELAALIRDHRAALRRTLERFALPDPGAGGIDAVLAALTARRANFSAS